jgi:DNA-binding NarL/FixJ family response regulator
MPEIGIMILSQYVEERYALELIEANPAGIGYLLKDRVVEVDEFLAALHRVDQGGTVLDSEVVGQLLGRRRRKSPLDTLTPREREVLALLAEGRTNTSIAKHLFITDRAVEKHITNIFTKLQLPDSPDDHRRVLAALTHLRE